MPVYREGPSKRAMAPVKKVQRQTNARLRVRVPKASVPVRHAFAQPPARKTPPPVKVHLSHAQHRTVDKALKTADKYRAPKKVKKALLEAGLTETKFRSLPSSVSDRDSAGFLQQRPSQGWGPESKLRNVGYATKQFVLLANTLTDNYGSAGELAQAVQRSAYPDRYGQHSAEAEALLRVASRRRSRTRTRQFGAK